MTGLIGAAHFRQMFERSADAILLLDTVGNAFTAYNDAALAMLGCARAELAQLHPSALSPERQPDGRPSVAKADEMIAIAIREGSHRFEWVHCSPHRDSFWVEVLLTPLDPGPAPLLLVVWRDITARRQAEQDLRDAQKRESLGLLAGRIAHDLNNTLAAVSGHLDLARIEAAEGRPAPDHLDAIADAVERAASLSRQMFVYGGRAQPKVETIDLGAAISEIRDLLDVSLPKGVVLRLQLPPGLPAVRGDVVQLQQVVLNLVTHAGASVRSGAVEIVLGRDIVDPARLAANFPGQALAAGRCVVLTVRESAHAWGGQMHMFAAGPVPPSPALSATMDVLSAHAAGHHTVIEPSGDTAVSLYFPVAAKPRVAAGIAAQPRRGVLRGRVLLVDDEDIVRNAARRVLEFYGAEVVEAVDGQHAVELFQAGPERFAWVLMDLTMPRCDGHAAFLRMRALAPAVKVVLVSGWASAELRARFEQAPPAAFLEKPYRAADLVRVAGEIGVSVAV